MSEPAKSSTPSDGPITVETTTVACAGKGDTSGHPKVYIKIDPSIGTADCPYCAQTFQLDPNADLSGHH
ncbi:MAG: zinc-finger domain-containing protein [Rhodospirillaceae bacterium]|nr:zinc-finger domain-containing protein [Rhodospirillaceae bacterium]